MTNTGKLEANNKFLSDAFATSPSFELFELYVIASNDSNQEIYDQLALLADPKHHLGLFIAIAFFLELDAEAKSLVAQSHLEI